MRNAKCRWKELNSMQFNFLNDSSSKPVVRIMQYQSFSSNQSGLGGRGSSSSSSLIKVKPFADRLLAVFNDVRERLPNF